MRKFLFEYRLQMLHFARRVFRRHVYVARRGILSGLKRRGGLSFIPQQKLSEEERFFMHLCTHLKMDGKVIFDIGAAQGIFTLFFARAAGHSGYVVAFEPNPYFCEEIRENLRVNNFNGNVKVVDVALGKYDGKATLAFEKIFPGAGSIRRNEVQRISRLKSKLITVDVYCLDSAVQKFSLPYPDLVKIDTQGLEFDILQGMRHILERHHPALFVEIHATNTEWKTELYQLLLFLSERGYKRFYHVESNSFVTPDKMNAIYEDQHIYVV